MPYPAHAGEEVDTLAVVASRTKSGWGLRLSRVAKELTKASPRKVYRVLFGAFEIVAASGDVPRGRTLVQWMYGRAPEPLEVASVLSTQAIDGFCAAAGLADLTEGKPRHPPSEAKAGALTERVKIAEAMVRARVLANAYEGSALTDADWQQRPPSDPWRAIFRWRSIQALCANGREVEALTRLEALLGEWAPRQRGAGYGNELVLALDLALRHGAAGKVAGWVERHGARFADETFLLQTALCLPAVAGVVVGGALREVVGLKEAELDAAMDALDTALRAASAPKDPAGPPKIQRRRVSAQYNQVHLRPVTLSALEMDQVHFQREDDADRGMSLFPTMVGIGTPSDTAYVDAQVSISPAATVDLAGAVRAVTFPLEVHGPLLLSSVGGDEDEPLGVPNGRYDVLARFLPKKAPGTLAKSNLRVFTLCLSFHPAGVLEAPKTLVLEE